MDREKVISKIEEEIRLGEHWDEYCRMIDLQLLRDAIDLLNEQDPVEPELEGGGSSWWHVCGDCHGIIDKNDNFCKHCGRRIKHEKKAE